MTNDGLVPGCGIASENCKFHFRNFSIRDSLLYSFNTISVRRAQLRKA